tara:strand:+ start:544 stop:813 length:270 start_codon:yes stop_codon:yes gene_type:complete
MSNRAKKYIDIIMSDGKPRSAYQILDELYKSRTHSANRYIPTKNELYDYMHRNYSSEVRRERHPLALPDDYLTIRVTYYWRELDDKNNS